MAKIYNFPGIGIVNSGTQFVLDGFQFPNNWLELATAADLSSRNITVTEVPDPPPSIDDVVVERNRRLALGFEYDFEDERGIHVIGTTEDDMKGWDEVSKGIFGIYISRTTRRRAKYCDKHWFCHSYCP